MGTLDYFHISRFGLKNIPNTFIGLEKWLQELWREKDQLLDNVYNEGLRFPATSSRQILPQPALPLQYVAIFAWFSFLYFVFSSLFSLTWLAAYMWLWIVAVSCVMAAVSEYTDGVQEIEILLEKGEFWPRLKSFLAGKIWAKIKGDPKAAKSD